MDKQEAQVRIEKIREEIDPEPVSVSRLIRYGASSVSKVLV